MLPSRHRSNGSRWLGVFLLLLQLGLPAAVSAVETIRDADAAGRVVHVESEGTDGCGLHHDHRFCQVIRNLVEGERRMAPPPLVTVQPGVSSSSRPAPRRLGSRSLWFKNRHPSRAPPAA